jgi:hypothetical protein
MKSVGAEKLIEDAVFMDPDGPGSKMINLA